MKIIPIKTIKPNLNTNNPKKIDTNIEGMCDNE